MGREGLLIVVLAGVLLLFLAGAALGAFGLRSTTSVSDAVPAQALREPPADGSTGVVMSTHSTGGWSIAGVRVQSPTYVLHAGVVVPPQCVVRDGEGRERLRDDGECAGLPLHGEVSGGGTTSAGDTLVILRFEVSAACFEVITAGDAWPSDEPACAGRG